VTGSQRDYYEYMGYPSAELTRRYTRYAELFSPGAEVLDMGCGRGEFLALLEARGVDGTGIDQDADMVALVREAGRRAEVAEAHAYLRDHAEAFDGVFAAHIVEHLAADEMVDLVRLAMKALRRGGRLVVVTPNPHNLHVHLYEFWTDLQHVRFYTPDIMRWVFHDAGLVGVESGDNPVYKAGPEFSNPDGRSGEVEPLPPPPILRWRARLRQRVAEWLEPASSLERIARLERRMQLLDQVQPPYLAWAASLYPGGEFYVTGTRADG
jgi:SAM-dependent methyltransferase